MDEAFVVLVADNSEPIVCHALPFATRRAAEEAMGWLATKLDVSTTLIDDHERE